MGEIAINPIHNVHKKYRTMNFVNPYIFAPPVDLTTNTEIGGVASTISTPALLANKLDIDVSRISNFTIVGSDIKCKITGSYSGANEAFNGNSSITYYDDKEGLIVNMIDRYIRNCANIQRVNFPKVQTVIDETFMQCPSLIKLELPELLTYTGIYAGFRDNSNLEEIILPKATSLKETSNAIFTYCIKLKTLYIPYVTELGTSQDRNGGIFTGLPFSNLKIYTHPSMATINAGGVEGDLAYAISQGATVRYVTNFIAPNPVTTLSAGTIYNTAIQLNFTPPSSTNAIEYYECYANGILKNKITASGQYITGLTASTSYAITVIAIDVFYNKSTISNNISVATTNVSDSYYVTDTDATAYLTAAGISSTDEVNSTNYLFFQLKNKSLFWKTQAIYPFKGTTASQHKFNAKNPIDTDGAFRLTFTGAATFSNLGYQLNGTSYADTHFIPSANQSVNNNGLTLVCGTNNSAYSADTVDLGSYNSATQANLIGVKNNNTNYNKISRVNGGQVNYTGTNESRGILTVAKQSSTVTDMFWNGAQVSTGNSGGTLPTYPIWIGCLNYIGSQYGNTNQRIQIVIFHEGLSDTEVTTMHSIIDLSESIAGRKTW